MNIGDCFLIKIKEKYYGVILKGLSLNVEHSSSHFLVVDQIFIKKPTIEEVTENNVIGVKVKVDIGFSMMFDSITIINDNLGKIFNESDFLGNLILRKDPPLKIGGVSFARDLTEFEKLMILKIEFKINGKLVRKRENRGTVKINTLIGTELNRISDEIIFHWILSKKNSHPRSLKLLDEDFFWSSIDESAPFGNDDGADALYGFQRWRLGNPEKVSIKYIDVMEMKWGLIFTHLQELDVTKIESFKNESYYFISIDKGIIGLAFGELVLDGKVFRPLLNLAIKAINRLLNENVLKLYGKEYAKERQSKLEAQLRILNKL